MARGAVRIRVQIADVLCRDEADGVGDAEPYIWPVFFKIDGENYVVANGLTGNPWTDARDGGHGNLNDDDVDAKDLVLVPEPVGLFDTVLKPIPVIDPAYKMSFGDDLAGIVGVVVVLMEQDGWPDDVAETGYNALVDAVRLSIANLTTKFQHRSTPPAPDEIDAELKKLKDRALSIVRGAILDKFSGKQVAWYGSLGNNDDQLGVATHYMDQDAFAKHPTREFIDRWTDDDTDGCGDWQVRIVFRNLDVRDTALCDRLGNELASLRELLAQTTDLQQRKQLLDAIASVERQQKAWGCI
jgi:hypothetical protein